MVNGDHVKLCDVRVSRIVIKRKLKLSVLRKGSARHRANVALHRSPLNDYIKLCITDPHPKILSQTLEEITQCNINYKLCTQR